MKGNLCLAAEKMDVLRANRAKLGDMAVSYTALFRPREAIDVSDGFLYNRTSEEMIALITGMKPWRSPQRGREIMGISSPLTPL
jgi:hypothetical protein